VAEWQLGTPIACTIHLIWHLARRHPTPPAAGRSRPRRRLSPSSRLVGWGRPSPTPSQRRVSCAQRRWAEGPVKATPCHHHRGQPPFWQSRSFFTGCGGLEKHLHKRHKCHQAGVWSTALLVLPKGTLECGACRRLALPNNAPCKRVQTKQNRDGPNKCCVRHPGTRKTAPGGLSTPQDRAACGSRPPSARRRRRRRHRRPPLPRTPTTPTTPTRARSRGRPTRPPPRTPRKCRQGRPTLEQSLPLRRPRRRLALLLSLPPQLGAPLLVPRPPSSRGAAAGGAIRNAAAAAADEQLWNACLGGGAAARSADVLAGLLQWLLRLLLRLLPLVRLLQ
jgi:hypothetical protein